MKLSSTYSHPAYWPVRALFICLLALANGLWAQGSNVGVIQGRVFNPATAEYVRNAEISVDGTNLLTYTEEGGFYTLQGVPAGQATVRLTYTGYATQTANVSVTAGSSSMKDFELMAIGLRVPGRDQEGAIVMEAVTVSADREGNAKAIMEQRRSMNISTAVAADSFGDVSEGNVGEFLKLLPGVDIEYVDGVSRGPRLGGLDQQYVGVTMNGASLASADAYVAYGATINGTTGGSSRSVGFEQISITSIESIEISRTLSADMDANSPAGSINMKTKRAFDRKGRRIDWQVSLGANSGSMSWRDIGPDDFSRCQIRPSYMFDYSDVFMNQRLGIRFGFASSDVLMQQQYVTHTYNKTTTAADQRPMVLTAITFADGPKFVQRFNTNLSADFKATKNLILSFNGLFNAFGNLAYTKNYVFSASANSTASATGRQHVIGSLTDITTDGLTTNTGRTFAHGGGSAVKLTNTVTLTPRFEYKLASLLLDGGINYSRSKNDYETSARGTVRSETVNSINVDFHATRPSTDSAEWTIKQLGGPDWSDLRNFTNPRITEEGRYALTEIYTGDLNAKVTLPFTLPSFVKFGGKIAEEYRKTDNLTPDMIWSYIGPNGGTTGNFADYPSPRAFNTDFGRITALTIDKLPPLISRNKLAQVFLEHPEYFVNSATTDNFYNAYVANRRNFKQTVESAYGMANTRVGKLRLQAGLRWERTETISKEFDPIPSADVIAAGFPVSTSTRRATTVPGIVYQYLTKPQVDRKGVYDDFFPSASAKYMIRPNLHAEVGYSYAISRPPIDALAGVWSINDVAMIINAPNPNLKPEYSDNYVARLAYYFEPVGSFTALVQQTEITNQRVTKVIDAADYGYGDDPAYADYDFSTQVNNDTLYRYRSLELSYNQTLSFLPGLLKTTSVNLSYTRNYANQLFAGVTPHRYTGGLGWTYGRFNVRLNAIWADDTPYYANSYYRFLRQNVKVDLNAGWRLGRGMSLFLQGRNIFNDPQLIYEGNGTSRVSPVLYRYGNYGVSWTLGVRGSF